MSAKVKAMSIMGIKRMLVDEYQAEDDVFELEKSKPKKQDWVALAMRVMKGQPQEKKTTSHEPSIDTRAILDYLSHMSPRQLERVIEMAKDVLEEKEKDDQKMEMPDLSDMSIKQIKDMLVTDFYAENEVYKLNQKKPKATKSDWVAMAKRVYKESNA